MAGEANTVSLSTNFNVDPYYDDFDESKNFHRILFRPGLAVQARELTQMQTILQNQIDRFAEHIFKEGSTVRGFNMNFDVFYHYVRIRDKTSTNGVVNAAAFLNRTLRGISSGVRALVVNTNDGSEANTPHTKTLFVKYIAANTNGTKYFSNNEILTATDGSGLVCNTVVGTVTYPATGYGIAATFDAGIVFAKDHFIRVPAQTVVLSKYDDQPSKRVGFDVTESIITETSDSTLLDPAQGSYNYAAPGAARLQLTVDLKAIDLDTPVSNTFVELMQVKDGIVQSISNRTQYSAIRDYIAQRTYDESGDYVVSGLGVNLKEHLKSGNNQGIYTAGEGGSASKLVVIVEPGKAYVKGYDNELIVSNRVSLDKAIEYSSLESAKALVDYGNYIIVDNVSGQWDVNRQGRISLRDSQANSVSNKTYSSASFTGAHIGSARVRGIEHYTGTPGLPSAQYKLYLTDINMNAGKSFTQTQFIGWNGGVGSANGMADVLSATGLSANTVDSSFDRAVFRLPANAIKKLRDTSGNVNNDFSFYKSFDIQFNSSGVATINTGDTSETFDGSGVLSDAATRTDFYIVSRQSGNTTTFSETLTTTSGSNTVTASASVDGKINPGDLINIHTGGGTFLVSAVSGSTINLFGNATASGSGKAFHKRFVSGQILDLAGVGKDGTRTITISGTPSTTATIDINETLNSTSMNATAVVTLNKIDGQEAAKVVVRNRLVQIRVGAGGGTSYTANTTGPWPLGLSDGFKLVSVRKKSGANFSSTTEGTDVTSHFTLDTGMLDNYYSHAQLVKKPSSSLSIASGDRLLVKFDHFTHSYTSGSGFFSVDSYPVDDANAGTDTTKIYTYEIPLFTSKTSGVTFDLRDCVDIRPRLTDSANSVTSLTNISINPKIGTAFDQPSGGLHFSPSGQDFTTDLDYYLRRNDVVSMSKDGTVHVTKGVAALKPATPQSPADNMPLASISLAPYPSLPFETARRVGRADLSNSIRKIKNDRYTMKDIGKIAERIDRLEYYTALNLLEKNTKDLLVPDENGLDRFKNGILVDSFTGHNIGNVHDADYKVAVDSTAGEMRPLFSVDNVTLNYSANSSHVVRTNVTTDGIYRDQTITLTSAAAFLEGTTVTSGPTTATVRRRVGAKLYVENATGNFASGGTITGFYAPGGALTATISSVSAVAPGDLVTLPYSHKVLVDQPYATTTRNTAGSAFMWKGDLQLSPDSDIWYDTTTRPDVNINIDLNTDNWLWLANSWQTQWNGWQTSFVGESVLTETRTRSTGTTNVAQADGSTNVIENFVTESIFTAPTIEVRSGVKDVVTIATEKQSYGNFVRDVNINPFMRSNLIFCRMIGMKPSSRLYAFFDGTNVSAYITPLTAAEWNSRLKTPAGTAILPAADEGDALSSNADGVAYCVFRLPNDSSLRFRTGTKRLRFVDNPTNSTEFGQFTTAAEEDYTAEGLTAGVSDLTVSTKRPVIGQRLLTESRSATQVTGTAVAGQRLVGVIPAPRGCGGSSDPIAQTFFISGLLTNRIETTGMYLTKIDLFFATKDSSLPVIVKLHEVDPASGAVTPKILPFSRVVVPAADVNISTDGSAATPVYFPSPVYVSEDKEYAVVVEPAGTNPNYTVFTAVLGENDILTGGRITQQPAAGNLFTSANQSIWNPVENEDLKFTLYFAEFDNSSTGSLIVKNENRDHFVVSNATGGFLKAGEVIHGESTIIATFANTKTLFVANGSTYIQGMTSNATGRLTSYASNKVTVRDVSISTKFVAGEHVRIRNSSATSGPIVGNTTATIKSITIPVGRVSYYDVVNFANTKLYVANVAQSNSGTYYANGRLFSTGSWVRGQTNGYSARIVTIENLAFDNLNLQTNMIVPSNTGVTAYAKFATSTSARDSSYFKLNVNDNNEFAAPRYILSKSIEGNTSASSATMATAKSAEIKYEFDCRNIVASPAIDLRRISMIGTHNLISSNAEIGSSEDSVKFGGNSKTRYITRKVTLADGQDAEDLRVYLSAYKPTGSEVYVYYKVLSAEDSDSFTDSRWTLMQRNVDQGFTSTTRYSSSENKDDFFEMVFDVPAYANSALSGANNTTGIIEYRNSSRARFSGFKYFAIKVVLTSETSSNPPRVRELRAIALQM